jgi:preprotein translocase subunit SecB
MNSPQMHPMQIMYVGVKELVVETLIPPDPSSTLDLTGKMAPKYRTGVGKYDENNHDITVFSACEIGSKEDQAGMPLYLKVVLGVRFAVVDPVKFSPEDVIGFAQNYSRYLIHPFMREHVFALSARAGFRPIILPALLLPVFKKADMVERPAAGSKQISSVAPQVSLKRKKKASISL